jgi:hypothetical protein
VRRVINLYPVDEFTTDAYVNASTALDRELEALNLTDAQKGHLYIGRVVIPSDVRTAK